MWRKLIWLFPATMLALLVYVLCAALTTQGPTSHHVPTVTAGEFPRTITERNGRVVRIARKPMRIVAADAGSADVLAALVPPERIQAVPSSVDGYAGATDYFKAHPQLQRFEKFDAEVMLAIKPDLVLASSVHSSSALSVLAEAGIPVLIYDSFQSFDGVRNWIACAGRAVGEESTAEKLIAQFDARLQAVERAVAGRKRPRALAYSKYTQGFTVGSGESQDEVLRSAGASNAAAEMNLVGHVSFSFEQMLKLNPDVLVVGGDQGLESAQARLLLNGSVLADLPAIKARRIAVVPDRYFSAISHHVVEAVEILARQLHPEAFAPAEGSAQ